MLKKDSKKTATVSIRMQPELKEKAEKILAQLEVTPTTVVTALYRQIVIKQGVPFQIDLTEEKSDERSNKNGK